MSRRGRGLSNVAGGPPARSENDLTDLIARISNPLLLILDHVQDPHNLGACLRTADAAEAAAVIVPKDRSAPLSEVACHVARGAAEHIPFFRVTNLARTMRELKDRGVRLVGTADDAPDALYAVDLTGPLAIVMGAEGDGMRRLTREHCDALARIPMGGVVGCLNVSVAAGVCLFEAVRQRMQNGGDSSRMKAPS